jgi:single-strand DNA-binding protein
MALNLNKCVFAGHLGGDPDLKGAGSGNVFCTGRLACTRSWKDKDGEWQERTSWVSLVANGWQAEKLSQCVKGQNIYVEGSMEDRKYMKDGNDVWVKELRVNDLKVITRIEPKAKDDSDLPF